jgi:hypothetical protein
MAFSIPAAWSVSLRLFNGVNSSLYQTFGVSENLMEIFLSLVLLMQKDTISKVPNRKERERNIFFMILVDVSKINRLWRA